MTKVAIAGMGRIGRTMTRRPITDSPNDIMLLTANDLFSPANIAYPTKYGYVHGTAPMGVESENNLSLLGPNRTRSFNKTDPSKMPWHDAVIDTVLYAGHFESGKRRPTIWRPCGQGDGLV